MKPTLLLAALALCALAKNIFTPADLAKALAEEEDEIQKRKNVFDFESHFQLPKRQQAMTLLLQSVLPQISDVSIFSGYLRDDEPLLNEMGLAFLLIVAPSDEAIYKDLNGVKPWEFPEQVLNDASDDEVVARNLDSFLRAHIALVHGDVVVENETFSTKMLNGQEITIRHNGAGAFQVKIDGKWFPVAVAKQAENGTVFVVNTVLAAPK